MSSTSDSHAVYGLADTLAAGGQTNSGNDEPHDHDPAESNDHLASMYDDRAEQFATVVPFVRQGLTNGERCLYVADDNSTDVVRAELEAGGIDVDRALETGALSICTKAETYLRTGEFDGETMVEFWEESLEDVRNEAEFEGIRAAAEMTWALESDTDPDDLLAYEARLNTIYPGEDYVVLCQYNRTRFPPDVLADVVRTHPLYVHDNTVSRSSVYRPPDAFGPLAAPRRTDGPSSPETAVADPDRGRLLEESTSVIVVLDEDGRCTYASPATERRLGHPAADMVGDTLVEYVHSDDEAAVRDHVSALLDQPGQRRSVEFRFQHADGTWRWLHARGQNLLGDPELDGLVLSIRDITDRREAEDRYQTAERKFDAVFENPQTLTGLLDRDGTLLDANGTALGFVDESQDEVIGEPFRETPWWSHSDDLQEQLLTRIARAADGNHVRFEADHPSPDGGMRTVDVSMNPIANDEGTVTELLAVGRDITERKHRQARLAGLTEVASQLLEADTRHEVGDIVVDVAASLLDLPVALIALPDTGGQLQPIAATAAAEATLDGEALLGPEGPGWRAFAQAKPKTLESGADGLVSDAGADGLVSDAGAVGVWPLGRHGVFVASMDASAGTPDDAFGATVAATMHTALDNAENLQLLTEREARLTDLTDELERLTRVNDVIRRIDRSLVRASTRSEIETVVCEELAGFDAYRFVVVSEYDRLEERVLARDRAGDGKGYPEAVEPGAGVTGTAATTREPHVVQELMADPPLSTWRDAALTRGFGSCLALPLCYNDTLYGVLTVFGDRPGLFDEMERTVLTEMADNIAHTMNAVERKQALVSDRVVELEFAATDAELGVGDLATELGCTVDFEGIVPEADGRLRAFFSVSSPDRDAVRAALARAATVQDCQVVTKHDDSLLVSCRFTEAAWLPRLVDHGVRPRELTVDPGEARLVVEMSPTSDARGFVETLQAEYPGMELVAKREHERSLQTRQGFRAAIDDALTDRQREILDTAYHSGYFESPRVSSGETVADSLGISQPTFAEHLRTATRKIMAMLHEESPTG